MFSFILCDPMTQPMWGTRHTRHTLHKASSATAGLWSPQFGEIKLNNENLYVREGGKFHSNITNDQKVTRRSILGSDFMMK